MKRLTLLKLLNLQTQLLNKLISYIKAVFIQSITEFFPVSSGAHLLLFCKDIETPELLHLGTIIPVLIYFRKDLFKNFFIVSFATIPVITVGWVIKQFSSYVSMQSFTQWGILLGTLWMLFAELTPKAFQKKISYKHAFLIGLAQCLAFIPGFSRLGATLSMARVLEYDRHTAATFSFLLSVPAALGAVILTHPSSKDLFMLSPFIFLETVLGYISLWIFMKIFIKFDSRLLMFALIFYRFFIFWMFL